MMTEVRSNRGKLPWDRAPCRTFLATLGTAPAVVTETLWALMRHNPPWVPDRIEILTTSRGAPEIVKSLMVEGGPLATLFTDRPIPPVAVLAPLRDLVTIPVPAVRVDWVAGQGAPVATGDMGAAMNDVNDTEAATCMGDLILERLRAAKAVPGDEVHLSISGGRKTMSAHALFSLGLVGDLTDQASHVLMDPGFEYNRQFWHPDQGGLIHTVKVQRECQERPPREWPAPTLDPRDAAKTLRLFSIAAPRYDLIPAFKPKGAPPPRLSKIMDQLELAGDWRREPQMILDVTRNAVTICGREEVFDVVPFVWLRLLATATAEGWACDRDHPAQPAGAVTSARLLFLKPDYGMLDDLARWENEAITAGIRNGGDFKESAQRQEILTGSAGPTGKSAGIKLSLAVDKWKKELAESQRKGATPLASQQEFIAQDLQGKYGSFTKLRSHLEEKFGLALAAELVSKTGGAKGKHDGLPLVAYRLGGARAGFLRLVGGNSGADHVN